MTDHGRGHDEFLLRLRAQPRPEFAAALYAKITSEHQPSLFRRFIGPAASQVACYVAALCLAFAIIAVIAPSVRAGMAQTIQTLKQIGGATVVESNRGWDETHHPTPRAGEPRSVAKIERVSVAEARTRVPYAFALPAWTPEGAALTDRVEVVDDASVILYWTTNGRHSFILRTYPPGGGTGLVGVGSTQEVTINGQPAALIRGMWEGATGQWSRPHFVTLHWSAGGVTYELLANTNEGASEGELLRIAESIR